MVGRHAAVRRDGPGAAVVAGYGTERRVLLLHGPVGSAKSTVVRRLKKGLERYTHRSEGKLFTFDWYIDQVRDDGTEFREHMPCPMHEEPLHLIPPELRYTVLNELNGSSNGQAGQNK